MNSFTGLPVYCTREDIQRALDVATTARDNDQIDRHIDGAARDIDRLCARYFYPRAATLYWDWPNVQMGRAWRLWLDRDELLSLTSIVTGGVTVPTSAVYLEPNRHIEGPYSRIEMRLDDPYAFGGGPTPQRDIAVTGVWGYTKATTPAGTLAGTIGSGDTTLTVSDGALVGVGDTILIDLEYMQVTGRRMADAGQAITGTAAAQSSAVTLTVSNGAAFDTGEVIQLDSERMLITDVTGNTLTVKRAWDGTVLASHTATEVYASRTLTVTRGTLGTTASGHTSGATVARHAPPNLIRALAVAETMVAIQQDGAAWQSVQQRARQLAAPGAYRNGMTQVYPIDDLRERVLVAYGRKARARVI